MNDRAGEERGVGLGRWAEEVMRLLFALHVVVVVCVCVCVCVCVLTPVCARQLLKAKKEGKVAGGYDEGPLSFAPTYKFDPMSDTYDTSHKVAANCEWLLLSEFHKGAADLTYNCA